MNILYITTSLLKNESASIRNISLINGLIEHNCNVTAITLDYISSKEDKFLKSKLKKEVTIKKIPIPKFNKITSTLERTQNSKKIYSFSFLKKIKNILKPFIFFPDVLCEGICEVHNININLKDFDYIISSSDAKTSHFIARELMKRKDKDIPWIQIWGDPWGKDGGLANVNCFLKKKIIKEEKKLLEQGTQIFYISELTSLDIKKIFPQVANKVDFLLRSYLDEVNGINSNKDTYIFSYTGSVENRNLHFLIKSVQNYNESHSKKIELQFYGVSDNESVQFNGIKFIKVFPRVSFEKVLEVYKNSDVLVYIDNMGDTTQIPGKIYDYFGTNKVILGLYENTDIRIFLEKFNRVELYSNSEEFNLEYIINKIGTQKPLEEFSPKYVAQEFLKKIKGE